MTTSTREPSPVLRSGIRGKRAEEKPRSAVFITIFVIAIVGIAVLVTVMLGVSTKTTSTVLTKQEDYTLTSSVVVKGLFAVVKADYADKDNASCTLADDYQRPVAVVLRLHPYETPESCNIFVDSVLVHTEKRLEADCKTACTFNEFDKGFGIGEADYRDQHTIKICCNNICIDTILPSLCGGPAPVVEETPPETKISKGTLFGIIGLAIGLVLFIGILITVAKHHNKI